MSLGWREQEELRPAWLLPAGMDRFTSPDACRATYGEPCNGELDCLLRRGHEAAGLDHWAEVTW